MRDRIPRIAILALLFAAYVASTALLWWWMTRRTDGLDPILLLGWMVLFPVVVLGLAVELQLLVAERDELTVRQLAQKRLARRSMPRITPVIRWPGRV